MDTNGDLRSRIRELEDEVGEQAVTIARLQEKNLASEAKADNALEQLRSWQAGANEWRGAMNDREATFVRRDMYVAEHKALDQRVTVLETRAAQNTGKGSAYSMVWAGAVVIMGIGLTVLGLAFDIFGGAP